ncbi:hypothetical protein BDA99DRAFT_538883 [Phascolomyces articulosus]|uniref:Uncharacterized protein n=1 Tax=Phascolomyces articulosus TaxID=60185 RepID=A0AAD5PCI4_9FUNG|nr:hypothetical protein BDA99DRAFT_538883 [Phascolomyces articulosus]
MLRLKKEFVAALFSYTYVTEEVNCTDSLKQLFLLVQHSFCPDMKLIIEANHTPKFSKVTVLKKLYYANECPLTQKDKNDVWKQLLVEHLIDKKSTHFSSDPNLWYKFYLYKDLVTGYIEIIWKEVFHLDVVVGINNINVILQIIIFCSSPFEKLYNNVVLFDPETENKLMNYSWSLVPYI